MNRALALALLTLASCAPTPVERRGAAQVPVVSRSYPAELPTLRAAILHLFDDRQTALHRMQAIELIPPNYSPEWVSGWVDPSGFLERYQRVPAALRANDLLLEEATGDVYWPSEYVSAGQPVKFRCGFILHLAESAADITQVEVYEKVPEVWVGEHWAMSRHGVGFGKVHDIRFVEPTVKDRIDIQIGRASCRERV